jgi:hypothetical protein
VKARGNSTSGSEYSSTCIHGSCFFTPPWPPAELLPGLRVDRPISQRRNGSCFCCAAAAPLPPPVGVMRQNHVATAGTSIDMVSSATNASAGRGRRRLARRAHARVSTESGGTFTVLAGRNDATVRVGSARTERRQGGAVQRGVSAGGWRV